MTFSFFKDRISKTEINTLELAERTLGISLVNSYKKLSKRNRAVFLRHAEEYNKAHSEYLEMKLKYD